MKNEIDWMGRWYDIIKERGENDLPTFGKLNLSDNTVDWMNFSHAEMDGVGAMLKYYNNQNLVYPGLRETAPPSLRERFHIFYRLLFKTKKLKTIWKETNYFLEPADPKKIHWHIFSADETLRLEAFCKKNKYSTNAFLMNITTKYLLNILARNSSGTWTLPVNLRPVLKKRNILQNHSSGILISMTGDESPMKTHQSISSALKNKQHWGIWWIHQIGKFIGFKGMKYISNSNAKKSFMIGSFSNLSSWDLPEDEIWIGSPPGSKNFPISVMVMKANHRLSFSLKVHPFIMKDQQRTPVLLKGLCEEILTRIE